jgi:hypothetical protein
MHGKTELLRSTFKENNFCILKFFASKILNSTVMVKRTIMQGRQLNKFQTYL